jgi:DNA-binding GntR family transcriptional regulator
MSGEFAPYEQLSERSRSTRLELGRTPIHQALKTLAQGGLFTIHPTCGHIRAPDVV